MYDYETYDFSEFPETADEIAVFLTDLGYAGQRVNAEACPIANYLNANVARPGEDYTGWLVCMSAPAQSVSTDATVHLAMHPDAVAQFISWFDDRCYPALERY